MKLDTKTVATLTLPEGRNEQFYWDETLKGFALRLRSNGSATWCVQYKSKGRTRRITLGDLAKLTAGEAREVARKHFAAVLMGDDPADRKAKQRLENAQTMLSVAKLYLGVKKKTLRPRSYTEVARFLEDPRYFGDLHAWGMSTIKLKDVAAIIRHINTNIGAKTASSARATLSALFTWSMGEGLVEANPVAGVNRPKTNDPRERVLTNEELRALWIACGDDDYGRIVRLLILTGCRREEIGHMRWSEIDLDKGIWTLPGARAKNKREMKFELPQMALDLLPQKIDGQDFVFGAMGGGYSKWFLDKKALDARLKIAPWQLRDIRRSVATGMGTSLGIAPHVIECLLNHVGGFRAGVAGVYNRSPYSVEMRNALAMWSDHVRALVEGERKIIPLKKA
jgi:integrase